MVTYSIQKQKISLGVGIDFFFYVEIQLMVWFQKYVRISTKCLLIFKTKRKAHK